MSADPVEGAIRLLGGPVEPRAEFGEDLLVRLVRELAPEAPAEAVPPARGRPRPPRRPPKIAIGAAALASAAVVAIVLVLTLTGSPSALAVIEEAQKAFADVPPFRATVSYDLNPEGSKPLPGVPRGTTATIEISYRGQNGYREETLEMSPVPNGKGGPGSFTVWDGERIGQYLAQQNRFASFPPWAGFEPLREFSWNAPYPNWADICRRGGSSVLADAEIAGRPARHVRCGDWRGGFWELWIDRETGVMLEIVGPLPSDDFRLGTSAEGGFEVTSIEYDPVFAPDTFSVVAPAGATDTTVEDQPAGSAPPAAPPAPAEPPDPYSVTSLKAGEPASTWTAPLVGGGSLSLEELRGRPALVLLMPDWCPLGDPVCDALAQLQQAYERWGDRVGFVWVDNEGTPEEAEKVARHLGIAFPAVADGLKQNEFRSEVEQAWGVEAWPLWVLLDADGRVAAVLAGPQSVEHLDDVLDGAAR